MSKLKHCLADEFCKIACGLPSTKVAAHLAKHGAVTPEEAMRSLEMAESLEKAKPTPSQVGRYALLGAAVGPAVGIGRAMLRKGPTGGLADYFKDVAKLAPEGTAPGLASYLKGVGGGSVAKGVLRHARHLGADAAAGAVTSGGIPLVRAALDRQAAAKTLRKFMAENAPQEPPAPVKIASSAAEAAKEMMEDAARYAAKNKWGKFWHHAQHEAVPALGAIAGAGIAAHEDVNPLAGSAAGYGSAAGAEALTHYLLSKRHLLSKKAAVWTEDVKQAPSPKAKALRAMRAELGPALGMVAGAGLMPLISHGASPLTGAAIGYGLGAIPEVVHAIRHRGEE